MRGDTSTLKHIVCFYLSHVGLIKLFRSWHKWLYKLMLPKLIVYSVHHVFPVLHLKKAI